MLRFRLDQWLSALLLIAAGYLLLPASSVPSLQTSTVKIKLLDSSRIPVLESSTAEMTMAEQSTLAAQITPVVAKAMLASVSAQAVYAFDLSSNSVLLAKLAIAASSSRKTGHPKVGNHNPTIKRSRQSAGFF